MPNKVALKRIDDGELLGLMSYFPSEKAMAVEIIYVESAGHSNANLLGGTEKKKYLDSVKALFAFAVQESLSAGYDGVLVLKAKTSKLVEYYRNAYGAKPTARYDPFRLAIWETEAMELIRYYEGG